MKQSKLFESLNFREQCDWAVFYHQVESLPRNTDPWESYFLTPTYSHEEELKAKFRYFLEIVTGMCFETRSKLRRKDKVGGNKIELLCVISYGYFSACFL